jgi:hypothetical protein
VKKGSAVGVEFVEATNDFYSPVSGEILAVNKALNAKPELVNQDAEGAGWIYKIKLAERRAFGPGGISRLRAGARLMRHLFNARPGELHMRPDITYTSH